MSEAGDLPWVVGSAMPPLEQRCSTDTSISAVKRVKTSHSPADPFSQPRLQPFLEQYEYLGCLRMWPVPARL